jgi:hypothetical protein
MIIVIVVVTQKQGKKSEAIILMSKGKQEALRKLVKHKQRQRCKLPSILKQEAEKRLAEQEKINRFICGARCRRIELDSEMDGRTDRWRCEEGEERCDVCRADDLEAAEIEQQRDEEIIREEALQEEMSISITEDSEYTGFYSNYYSNHIIDIDIPGEKAITPTGFNNEMITSVDRIQFVKQEEEQQQRHLDIIAENQQDAQEVWQLAEWLDRWVGKCAICYIKREIGEDVDTQHALRECGFEEERTIVEDEIQGLTIRFQKFSGCVRCMVPQDICNRWELVGEGRKRFQEKKGEECQYKGIVKAAVAGLFIIAPEAVIEKMYEWMRSEGVWVGREEKIREEDVKEVKAKMIIWFGKKIRLGGVELNVCMQAFGRMNRWLWEEARGL